MEQERLTDICNPKQWKTIPTSDLLDCGYPVYGANGVIGYYSEYNHENPTVTITCRGATCGRINITAPKAYVTGNAMCLDDIRPDIDLKYLYYCLLHYDFSKAISGSAQPQITRQGLEKVNLRIGTPKEQQMVIAVLDQVKALIESFQRRLSALNNLIKARFIEMFGDPATNIRGWNTKPLLSMGSCKNGMNFHYDDSGVEINCLGVGDFKNYSTISDTASLPTVSLNEMPSSEYLLKDDDIVFVRSNGNRKMVGRSVAVYPGAVPTTFSGFCIRYRKEDNSVITPYLLMVLKMESMRQKMYGRGANIQNLNQQILSSLNIPVPPMVLQEHFASFVSQVDKSKVVAQKALDKTQHLFDSLMQKYFG